MPDIGEFMEVWRQPHYGPATGTERAEIPIPEPSADQVLVRVRATALNAGDIHLLHGSPLLARLAFGLRRPRVTVRGMDIAGEVVSRGSGVSVPVGTRIVTELPAGGGLAPYAVVSAARAARIPGGVGDAVAASLPIAAGTAQQALDRSGVRAGERLLVLGASGGVGTFLVQLASLLGVEVWATCGEPNRLLVERLGATRTFDYRSTTLDALPGGAFDAIIDIAAGESPRALRARLATTGTAVLVGGDGGAVLGPVPRMAQAAAISAGRGPSVRPLAASFDSATVERHLGLVASGQLEPVIERVMAWDDARAGLIRMESHRVVGKLVIAGR